jgi:hypothetical protein
MATGTTLITQVRDILQDTTDESFGTAEILRYLNRGAKEFCSTTGCYQKTATINTDNSNFKFTLSATDAKLFLVFDVEFNGVPLSQTFRHEVSYEFGASSGTPDNTTSWYQFGDPVRELFIELVAPTATGSSALKIFYLRTPTDMTAEGSTFDFPDEWESAIVNYAIGQCYGAQRDTILEAKHMGAYYAMKDSAYKINRNKLMGNAA